MSQKDLDLDFVSFIFCKLKDPERDIKKFLKLKKKFLSNNDLNFAPKVFRISPQLGYKICFEILKNKAKFDIFYFWESLKSCPPSLERNASIGILLNFAFSVTDGEFGNPQRLLIKKYDFAKNEYQNSGYSLGLICDAILSPEDKFVIVDGGAQQTNLHQIFSNVPEERLKIYAFEPFPEFAQLERDRFRDSILDIDIKEIGLWNCMETKRISSVGSPSFFPRDANFRSSKNDYNVKLDSLNNIIPPEHKNGIDFLKLNIEGSELNALRGASDHLENIQMIRTEVKFFHDNEDHPLYFQIAAFLHDWNFRLIELAKPKFAETPEYSENLKRHQFTYLKDSWITPPPSEAHWLFLKVKGNTNTEKLLKRVIALEASGKIPSALGILKFLLASGKIPNILPKIGDLANYIEKTENFYKNIFWKTVDN